MSGISAVAGVGAGLSQVQFQVAYQTAMLKEQQAVAEDLGNAALKLVQSTLTPSRTLVHDLDV